jgi:hypothetical protein
MRAGTGGEPLTPVARSTPEVANGLDTAGLLAPDRPPADPSRVRPRGALPSGHVRLRPRLQWRGPRRICTGFPVVRRAALPPARDRRARDPPYRRSASIRRASSASIRAPPDAAPNLSVSRRGSGQVRQQPGRRGSPRFLQGERMHNLTLLTTHTEPCRSPEWSCSGRGSRSRRAHHEVAASALPSRPPPAVLIAELVVILIERSQDFSAGANTPKMLAICVHRDTVIPCGWVMDSSS